MRNIDLDSLEIFRTVAEAGGILRASERLNRVPSNVTTRIKQLESRLGVPLFRKQGRGIVLSRDGELLLSYAQRLFRLADEVESELRNGTPTGVFRIGSLESTAGSRLPPVLSKYHRQFPGVVIELVTGTTCSLVQRVRSHEIEAAFVSEPFDAHELVSSPVFEEELVLITAREVTEVRRASCLRGMTLIAFADGCSYRKRVNEWLSASEVIPARTLEFASYQAMIACVAAGTGFAVAPRTLLTALRATRDVAQHPLPVRIRRNRTHLIWANPGSSALRHLRAILDASVGLGVPRQVVGKVT
ncbi:MAG: LysR substrate-binding domain-containing protein [Pseudomonadota bacterium]|nr:LysR substrate-binding domain-containing protein [Pseudomonadota bacterium]